MFFSLSFGVVLFDISFSTEGSNRNETWLNDSKDRKYETNISTSFFEFSLFDKEGK